MQATTIICVRHKDKMAPAGDGQVTIGQAIIQHSAHKLRRLYGGKEIILP